MKKTFQTVVTVTIDDEKEDKYFLCPEMTTEEVSKRLEGMLCVENLCVDIVIGTVVEVTAIAAAS